MTNYQPGDIVLISFPYGAGGKTKNRPAMVVLDTGDADVLLARVTTQAHRTAHDVALQNWQAAGLLAPSTVRVHKLATLEKALVRRRLGQLGDTDRKSVAASMKHIYAAW